jgi:guanylate kinase
MTQMIFNTIGSNAEKEFGDALSSTDAISQIFVFTGPVGAGRHTIAEMIRSTHGMQRVPAYTTRQRRSGEAEGQDAYFIRPAEFFQAQQKEQFLEISEINGDLYGIKYQDIEQMRLEGNICLILDRDGTEKLKEIYGEYVVRIFVYAERNEQMRRLSCLGWSKEEIERQLSNYGHELVYKEQCEFKVENEDLAHTLYDLARSLDRILQRNLIELD